MMGHRLIVFLSHALPKHPDYLSSSVAHQRNRTFKDLVWINDLVEEIALKIDEEQLERYMTNEFTPEPDDASSVSTAGEICWSLEDLDATSDAADLKWEAFPAWTCDFSSDISDALVAIDNDTSGTSTTTPSEVDSSGEVLDAEESPPVFQAEFATAEPMSDSPDPYVGSYVETAYAEFEDFEVELDEYEDYAACHVDFDEDEMRSSLFLRKISQEDVLFEEDSEADDSWAQDDNATMVAPSLAESGASITCDPARLAFREIMNLTYERKRAERDHFPPPPPPPLNSPTSDGSSCFSDHEEDDDYPLSRTSFSYEGEKHYKNNKNSQGRDCGWADFDFAAVRQGRTGPVVC